MSRAHRACDDFRQTTAATRSRYVGAPLTRRQIVGAGLGASLAIYASRAMPFLRVLEAAKAEAAAAPDAPILVSVFLPGGCDLLSSFVPLHQYGRYADLRKDIKVDAPPELAGSGLGAHPALKRGLGGGVAGLFSAGKVGLLPGID